jgi:type II secretory pathway pseudopilin PulG
MLAHRRGRRASSAPDERGETLLELMATVVVMGLAIVAVLTALFTVINISDRSQRTSRINLMAHDYAEQLKQPIANGVNDYSYLPCANLTTNKYPAYQGTLPTGVTVTINRIRYWNNTKSAAPNYALGWANACPATDFGLQEIRIQITGTVGKQTVNELLLVVKRDQRCTRPYVNTDGKPC